MRPLPALSLALLGREAFSVVSLVTRGRLNSAAPLPPVPGAPGAGSATIFLGPTGSAEVRQMPGQIVTLVLPLPPAGVTHFQLQFRLFGVAGWTPFSTVDTPTVQANPPAGEDLPIEDLVAGEYVIDGQNAGATGNEVQASLPRTLYQACWKDADGYTNWGRTFRQKRVGQRVMVDLEPFILDLKTQLALIWPEILPSAGGGGVIDSEHLTTIPWSDVSLPLAVILIDRMPKAGGPLDKLWYQVPAEVYYVCQAPGSARTLRLKLTAAVNGLWATHPLTAAQIVDIEDPNWSDSLPINQVLRSAGRAQRGGRIIADCLVAELE